MSESPLISADIPCSACGYNLRALEPHGLCPECGVSIAESIQADASRRSVAPEPFTDRRVVVESIEGAILAIAALVMGVGIIFMPVWAFELKTRARAVMLGAMVAQFVVPWFAAWKLSTPEGNRRFESHRSARRVLRASMIGLFLTTATVLPPAEIRNSDVLKLAAIIVFLILQTLAAMVYYRHIGQVLRRLGSKILPILCYILVPINALLVLASFLPELDVDESSIGIIYRASTVQFGSLEWINDIFLGFRWGNTIGFWNILGVLWLICVLCIHVRLLSLAKRANQVLKAERQSVSVVRLY
jgi:hypothetical protein